MDQIRIGIVGYGNLGRGVEYALRQNPDMALVGVFTRRPPSSLTLQTPGVPVYPLDALDGMEGAVDVLLLCGGSAADLPEQSPRYAGRFHLVDSFDTHANIPAHFAAVDAAARAGGKTAIISAGWDPGLFSLVRALAAAVLPCGESYTFWGRGSCVDGQALAEVLADGRLWGAGLDVTDPEPLPPEHPLWRQPKALITPHTAGGNHLADTERRIARIALDNLRRYLAGEALRNRVR